MINIEKCKDEFLKYTERYDVSDEEIKRKQLHSLRVMQRSKIIAQSLKLSEEEIQVATLIGLLHDIGRFEQYTRYKTYMDKKSVDHGDLGVEILQENNYIKKYIEDENWINVILIAIKNHNKYKIEKGLNKEKELFCKIIRDADKADILYERAYIFLEYPKVREQVEKLSIKEEIYEKTLENKQVNRKNIKNINILDDILISTCFIFGVNFLKTLEIIKEDESINKTFQKLNLNGQENIKKAEEMKNSINKYIRENKG